MKTSFFFLATFIFLSVSCSKKQEPIDENALRNEEMAKENQQNTVKLSPEQEGKELINGADCLTCHQENEKLIGPSYTDVAAKYSDQDLDDLADKIVNGGSGVWGDVPMAAHPGLSKENAKKMVKYILSLKK